MIEQNFTTSGSGQNQAPEQTPQEMHESLFHHKFTASGAAITVILVMALLGLAERVLYDIARMVGHRTIDYFDDLNVIMAHGFFIIVVLVISLMLNFTLGPKKQKYALAVIPYFVVSMVLAGQLALQVTVYFANHHTKLQLYLVMVVLIAICTYAIYYIQDKFVPKE